MRTAHRAAPARELLRLLVGGIGLLAVFGLVWADSAEGFTSYALVAAAAVLPSLLWLRAGAPGIPVLPAVSALYYLYFAVPVLRSSVDQGYGPWEIFLAGATVASFLATATAASGLLLSPSFLRSKSAPVDLMSSATIRHLVFGGIVVGVLFRLATISEVLSWLGVYFGIVRSVADTTASIACYLLGYCRSQGLLRGQAWRWALAGLALMVVLSWSSLFLVGGMTFVLAAVFGYVFTSKRVPWKALAPVFAVLFVLHAGKAEMRARYWSGGAQFASIWQVPNLFAEWFAEGISAVATGQTQNDIVDRASLLDMLLQVQRLTPEQIPYLGGETYALLPSYLAPRFLDPDKLNSQAGLELLNIRYGLQTEEGASVTTIGWGVVCEAYANFGYGGVLGVGFLFGALAAFFTRWSAGASPLAMPTLLSLAALMTMINLEADLGYLLVNLWQALIAAWIFFCFLKLLSGRKKERPTRGALAMSRHL
jgi:hypothetical protein